MHILLLQFILLSILALVFYLLPIKEKKKELLFLIMAFIPMWYIHSMVEVGSVPDISNYENMFYQTKMMTWGQCIQYSGNMEVGYVLFTKAISMFSNNYYVLQGVYGFIILVLFFFTFRLYSPYAILSVLLLLLGPYNMSIYVIRQYFAVAIFVASIPLILQKRMKLYLLVCVLNFFIHRTSIICIPIYFIFQLKPYLVFVSSALIALIVFAGADMFELMSIESLADYQKYLQPGETGQNWMGAAIVGFELATFSFIMRKKLWCDDKIKLVFLLLLLTFFIKIVIIGRDGTINRLGSYYGAASLFALPYMLKEIKSVPLKVVVLVVFMLLKVYPTFFGSRGLGDLEGMSLII